MAIWQTAGKVRMTPKGVYNSSTAYEILDIVSNADQTISYIAKQAVPAGTALTNTTYWTVIADVTEALENADAAISYIGDSYSSSSTYAVGDYVIHDGGLYRCKTTISTAEAWTAAHWQQVSVTDEFFNFSDDVVKVSNTQPTSVFNRVWIDSETESEEVPTYEEFQELESDVSDLKSALNNVEAGDGTRLRLVSIIAGAYINANGNVITGQGSQFAVKKYEVASGATVRFYGKGVRLNGSFPVVTFRDSTDSVTTSVTVKTGTTTATDYDETYTAPSNGYIYIAIVTTFGELIPYYDNTFDTYSTIKLKEKISDNEKNISELDYITDLLAKDSRELYRINALRPKDVIRNKRISGYNTSTLAINTADDDHVSYCIYAVDSGIITFPYSADITGQYLIFMQDEDTVIPNTNQTATGIVNSTVFKFYGNVDTENKITTLNIDWAKTYWADHGSTITHIAVAFYDNNIYVTDSTIRYPLENIGWIDSSSFALKEEVVGNPLDVVVPRNIYGITAFPFMIYADQILCGATHRDVAYILDSGLSGVSYGKYYGNIVYCNNAFLTNTANPMKIKALGKHQDADIDFNYTRLSNNSLISGKTLKTLFIGDSLTYHRYYIHYLKEIFTAFGGTLESVGTLSRTVLSDEILCEGRSGWSAYDYVHNESFNGFTNAFLYNGEFDFSHYMSANNISCDIVCICLGTNDVLQHDVADMIPSYNTMIASIRAYNPTVPIILWLPPTRAIGDVYSTNKDKALSAHKLLIEYYDGKESNIYLAPVYFAVNPFEDYSFADTAIDYFGDTKFSVPSDYIHPSANGYKHVAQGFAHTLLYMCGTYGN